MNPSDLTIAHFRRGFYSRIYMVLAIAGFVVLAVSVVSLTISISMINEDGLDDTSVTLLSTGFTLFIAGAVDVPCALGRHGKDKKRAAEINAFIDKLGEQNFMYELKNCVYYSQLSRSGKGEIVTQSFVIDTERFAMLTSDISYVVIDTFLATLPRVLRLGRRRLTKYGYPCCKIFTLTNKLYSYMWRYNPMKMEEYKPLIDAFHMANPLIMFGDSPEVLAEHQKRIQEYKAYKI